MKNPKKKFLAGLTLLALGCCLIPTPKADAFDGEVYFGWYPQSRYRSSPNDYAGNARFVSGVEVGHTIANTVRPYVKLETLMDEFLNTYSFHPASIKYDIGIQTSIYKGLYLDVSHMCWHPVDNYPLGNRGVEQYTLVQLRYKFGDR